MPAANDSYWKNFSVSGADIERLYGFVLEQGEPVPTRELVRQAVEARVREEEARRARYANQAAVYQPKLEFQVGQRVIFPALRDAEGTVTAVRAGDNPRLAAFQVIAVHFDQEQRTREFAAAYTAAHPLNEERVVNSAPSDLSPEEILAEYGWRIEASLTARLRTDKEFIERDGGWLLRGLLPDVHEGYLNLAEAAIEGANGALTTAELVQVLELDPARAKKSTVFFALEYALSHDARFVNVGPRSQARWFLTRLQPNEAREQPKILQLLPVAPNPAALPSALETLVRELEDETDVDGAAAPELAMPILTLVLTYPHRRAGSLPLTPGVRALFPESDNPSMLVTLVDATNGVRIPAWYVRGGNYLAGLKVYYDQRKLHPGAFLQLQRRPEPLTASIEYQPQRERSLWVRVARVLGGRITFGTDRRPIAHKYAEEMLILVGDQAGLDTLQASNYGERPLEALLVEIFPELAKLSPGGSVHAKTLYSAVNFVRRTGPRAVLSALAQSAAFSSVGGGYFVLEAARHLAR